MALPYATEDQLKQLKTQLANVGNKSVKTKEELDALKGTDGQLVYCQGDSKLYIFKKDKWEEVGSDSVGKKVGYIELDAEQSRAFLANDSRRFELTESQIDTAINNDIIKITFSNTEEGETVKITLDFFKQLYNMSVGTQSVTYHCLYATANNTIITLMVGKFGGELTSELSQIQPTVPCTEEDNGKVLQVKYGQAQWSYLNFVENRPISLFGKHNILVPRDSMDSNITLYTHYISVSTVSSLLSMSFTILSSKDSAVDNITDLYTLIGTEARRIPCTGRLLHEGKYYLIVSMYWSGNRDYYNTTVSYFDFDYGERLNYQSIYDIIKNADVNDVVIPV